MTSTTQRNDAEELRKELLATISAGRELGPEMDDTLTDRFMERLSGLRPAGSYDQAGTRKRLATLLQSARGSDPAGDNALAEDFIAGIQPPRLDPQPYSYGGPPAPMPYGPMPPAPTNSFAQVAPMLICALVFIVALAVSGGHLWWIIFFLPAAFGWNRRNRYQQRRLYRDQRRDYRNDRILNRDEVYPPLPPRQQRPPEIL